MTKANILWSAINSIAIITLWLVILFTQGEFPTIKDRIDKVESKVEMIDYHLQSSSTKCDTIIINNYFQQQSVKNKK